MKTIDILTSLYESNIGLEVCDDNLKVRADKGVLDENLLASIREHKQALIELLKELENNSSSRSQPLHRFRYEQSSPLSFEQKSMLWLDKVSEVKYHYNMSAAYKLVGKLDYDLLTKAFSDLIEKHEILRTVYMGEDGRERQDIQEPSRFTINHQVFDEAESLNKLLEAQAKMPFDLAHERPIRATLITSSTYANDLNTNDSNIHTDEQYLCITLHHIAADGWSVGVFLRELSQAYHYRLKHNAASPDNGNGAQYRDYAHWQSNDLNAAHRNDLLGFWKEQLKDLPTLHNLPTDFLRPSKQQFSGATYQQPFPKELGEKINRLAKEKSTTPFVIFQSIFAALLKRYSCDEDIVFGTVTANRVHPELMNTIGMFANSLVLRYNVEDNCRFDDLIIQATEVSQTAFDHGQLPFDVLVDALQPERSLACNPLIQIMLVMQEDYHKQLNLDGISAEFIDNDRWVSKFDLSLHLTKRDKQWDLRWEYSTSLFKPSTIERIHKHFITMAELLLAKPQQAISTLPLVTLQELPNFREPAKLPNNNSVHSVFEEQAVLTPDKLAVFSSGQQLSYRQLNEQSSHLANGLWQHVEQYQQSSPPFIGVCLERGVDLVVSLLAIFKMGGVYVPIDPAYPDERIQHMVQDSGISMLLSNAEISESFNNYEGIETLTIDSVMENKNPPLSVGEWPVCEPEKPAYVIYTSGSTGKPKGVVVSHANIFQSIHANGTLMSFTSKDIMPCLGSVAFGASLLEILLPLSKGGTVHMLPKSEVADIADLIQHTSAATTVVHMVPSLMRPWLSALKSANNRNIESLYPNLRLVLTGGEAVPKYLLDEFCCCLPQVDILGLYGMTEASVVCFSHAPKNDNDPNHCLGVPHPHMQALILNEQQQVQPLGCAGELHLSGVSLAQGYLNQQKYTQERFINGSALVLSGQRLYKTGDRARLLDDGRFEFLGRADNQVSIRGFRIELGEIESHLRKHSDINEVLVLERRGMDDHQQLVAYFTGTHPLSESVDSYGVDKGELRRFLGDALPHYMVPSHFVELPEFPLNPNGKVNRQALCEIDVSNQQERHTKPVSEKEKALAEVWSRVLNLQPESIGVEDNFFHLGGDSILSLRMIEMARSMGIAITQQEFFQCQTIAELANVVTNDADNKEEYEEDKDGPLLLTPIQKSTLLLKKYDWNYYHTAIMRDASSDIEVDSWAKAFKALVEYHPALRSRFHKKNNSGAAEWSAEIVPLEQCDYFERIDFAVLDQEQQQNIIDQCTYQTINLAQGPVAKLFLFENKRAEDNAFLLVASHLVTDGVSLQILSDDLYSFVHQIHKGENLTLPKRTASINQAVSVINAFSRSSVLRKDLDYWLSLPWGDLSLFPTEFSTGFLQDKHYFGEVGNDNVCVTGLDVEETYHITEGIKRFPSINMSNVLTFCLVNVFAEWLDRQWIKIHDLNNGRTLLPDMENVDISRTVTFFSMYRVVCLQRSSEVSLQSIKKMCEEIQAIPNQGFGYDLLYWANEELDQSEKINFPIPPTERSLSLNYFGEMEKGTDSLVSVGDDSNSIDCKDHPKNTRVSQFFMNALIIEGKLTIAADYSSELYRDDTVTKLMANVNTMLKQVSEILRESSEQR